MFQATQSTTFLKAFSLLKKLKSKSCTFLFVLPKKESSLEYRMLKMLVLPTRHHCVNSYLDYQKIISLKQEYIILAFNNIGAHKEIMSHSLKHRIPVIMLKDKHIYDLYTVYTTIIKILS